MKKCLVITSSFLLVGVLSSCFADSFSEGQMALKQHDYTKAIDQLNNACDNGNAKGCLNLAPLYENGTGIAQNKYRASSLYAQACRGGEKLGCSNMALSYDTP